MTDQRKFEESQRAKSQRAKWRKSDGEFQVKVKVGDRVQYTVNFLRNTGQVASNNPRVHSTATVVARVTPSLASVRWDCDGPDAEPVMVAVSNLGHPATPRTCGGL